VFCLENGSTTTETRPSAEFAEHSGDLKQTSGGLAPHECRSRTHGMLCSSERNAASGAHVEQVRQGYLIDAVVRAQKVIEAFGQQGEPIRLRDVTERTGLGKNLCFRLLYTLRHCGVIEKVDVTATGWCPAITAAGATDRLRGPDCEGRVAAHGERRAHPGGRAGEHRADPGQQPQRPKVAVRNARQLVRQSPDLVIEFQIDESVAPAVAAQYVEAAFPPSRSTSRTRAPPSSARTTIRRVPRRPPPRALGQVAVASPADEIILIGQPRAGSVVASRVSGVLAGILEILPELEGRCRWCRWTATASSSSPSNAFATPARVEGEARAGWLRQRRQRPGRGAAFQEAGRAERCAVVGQNAERTRGPNCGSRVHRWSPRSATSRSGTAMP